MNIYPQKPHRRSIRLRDFDYTQAGAYFLTIVAFQRTCLFGDIVNREMRLNEFGLVAKEQRDKFPKRFPNIELGAFVIMPNHVHGIVQIINEPCRGTVVDKHIRRGKAEDSQNFGEGSPRYAPLSIRLTVK